MLYERAHVHGGFLNDTFRLLVCGLPQSWIVWQRLKARRGSERKNAHPETIELTQAVGETAAFCVSTENGWKFSGVRRFGTSAVL